MINNRTAQLIFQSMFCAIGILGIVASFGIFEYSFCGEFYVYFTHLSNYLCIGIMFAELLQTARKDGNSYVSVSPVMKFAGLLAILLTFLVFHILLAPTREAYLNYLFNSVSLHIILPVMYIADWFLFYEHKKVKWYYPMLSTIFPICYVIFIFIRAAILDYNTQDYLIYPYFFLDLEAIGVAGVAKWFMLLAVAFCIIGYVFMGLDRMIKPLERSK